MVITTTIDGQFDVFTFTSSPKSDEVERSSPESIVADVRSAMSSVRARLPDAIVNINDWPIEDWKPHLESAGRSMGYKTVQVNFNR